MVEEEEVAVVPVGLVVLPPECEICNLLHFPTLAKVDQFGAHLQLLKSFLKINPDLLLNFHLWFLMTFGLA